MKKLFLLLLLTGLFSSSAFGQQYYDAQIALDIPDGYPTYGTVTVTWYYDNGFMLIPDCSTTDYFEKKSNSFWFFVQHCESCNHASIGPSEVAFPNMMTITVILGLHPDHPNNDPKYIGTYTGEPLVGVVISNFTNY